MDLISFEKISKSYNGKLVVDDLSFAIKSGKIYSLLGESGSGKTTTLDLINGLTEPDKGGLKVFGQDITKLNKIELRRRTGYVFQGGGLFPHMSAFENISLVAKLEGWSEKKCSDRFEEMMSIVGLPPSDFKDKKPTQMSGGQRQRVAISRALFLSPDLLLMDEPFSALDVITRDEIQKHFLLMQRDLGFTVFMVTHDLIEAFKVSDQVLVLNKGRIAQQAPPKELIENPKSSYVSTLTKYFTGLVQNEN